MRILYNLAFILFGVFYLPYLIVTRRYRYGMKDRFGILPEKIKSICSKNGAHQGSSSEFLGRNTEPAVGYCGGRMHKIIWVHAVSVGEIKTAGILAPLLRRGFPSHTLLFSTVTHTGNKAARAMARGNEGVFYLPFDISFIVARVVKLVKPEIFISMETELWPNLIDSLHRSGSRLILANGRISNSSYPGYKKCRFFISALLRKFSLILMQSGQDADRIIALGAPKERVFVTGNLKFDIPLIDPGIKRLELRKKMNLNENEVLIVAGSTHVGEEEIIIDCFLKLKKAYPDLRLLIAPRHIERAKEIERFLSKTGFKSIRISHLFANHERRTTNDEQGIFLLDTMGDLVSMYSASDIVFVGKSLVKKGGQNPIEPASLGKPIIFGKYMFNFQDVVKIFLENNAGIEVGDKESLCSAIRALLVNPEGRKRLGINAKDTVNKNSGASQKTIDLILRNP